MDHAESRQNFSLDTSRSLLRRSDSLKLQKSEGLSSFCDGAGQVVRFPLGYDDLLERNLVIELVSTNSGSVGTRRCSGSVIKCGKSCVALSKLRPSDDELLIWVDLDLTINNVGLFLW